MVDMGQVEIGSSRYYFQVITWAIIFIGWFFVAWVQEGRERSKETFDLMRKLAVRIEDLMSKSILHHTTSFDPVAFRKITAEIKFVSDSFSELRRRGLVSATSSQLIIDLRKAITSTNYSATEYVCQAGDSSFVADIDSYSHELIFMIERSIMFSRARPIGFMNYFRSFFRSSR